MRAYPLVTIMLIALVGCGNEKTRLMQEYEFEKTILEKLEKELGELQDERDDLSDRLRASEYFNKTETVKVVDEETLKKLRLLIKDRNDTIKTLAEKISATKNKLDDIESRIREK